MSNHSKDPRTDSATTAPTSPATNSDLVGAFMAALQSLGQPSSSQSALDPQASRAVAQFQVIAAELKTFADAPAVDRPTPSAQ